MAKSKYTDQTAIRGERLVAAPQVKLPARW